MAMYYCTLAASGALGGSLAPFEHLAPLFAVAHAGAVVGRLLGQTSDRALRLVPTQYAAEEIWNGQ